VGRQQTLRASVDWSHTLLTERERILLRRLSLPVNSTDRTRVLLPYQRQNTTRPLRFHRA
jgi:predicted ATPase